MISLISDEELAAVSVSFENIATVGEILDEFGFAVITGVCSPEEIVHFEKLWGKDLAEVLPTSGIDESDLQLKQSLERIFDCTRSDREEDICKIWPTSSSLGKPFITDYGLPHGKLAWSVRLNPKVRRLYDIIYDGEGDLVTGMDVVFFNTKGEAASAQCTYSAHADQNFNVPVVGDYKVYQSALYLWPSLTEGDATTVVWPKSHKEHYMELMRDEAMQMLGKMNFHYCEIKQLANRELAKDFKARFLAEGRRVRMPAGSLLVWNSRTFHQVF